MSSERIRLIGISLWLQAGFRAAKYGPHDPVAGYDTGTCEYRLAIVVRRLIGVRS